VSSGGKGNSRATTSSQSSTTNEQTTVNQVDNRVFDLGGNGAVLVEGSGANITTTDFGAISGAADISRSALDLGRSALDSGNDVAIAGLDNAQRTYQGSLDFAGDVFGGAAAALEGSADRVARFATDALDSNSSLARETLASQSGLAGRAIDAVSDATGGVLDFASGLFTDALGAQKQLTDQNLTGLTALAKQTSASADDRVQKVALYAFVAVAAIMILPRLFK